MNAPQRTKNRVTLLLIVAVFTLPLVFAWVFTKGPLDWRPVKTVNHGVLVEPVLGLESHAVMDNSGAALVMDSVPGNWFLVVLRGSACMEECKRWLQIAERIQIAVGRDTPRVALAQIGPDIDSRLSRWQSWRLPPESGLFAALGRVTGERLPDVMLLIVDHRGRIVLVYPPAEDGRGALDDLKRLLRASAR